MFDRLIENLQQQITGVRNAIMTSDLLRSYYTGAIRVSPKNKAIKELRIISPDNTEWRIYDHCAAVTRLYSIYEGFVEKLIASWLNTLPDLVPVYADLDEAIRKTHRYGVGQLLRELDKDRYEDVRAEQVIQGIYNGLFASDRYELLPAVFLMREQNLRRSTLEKIFANAGVANCWNWIEKHRNTQDFIRDVRGHSNTAESELTALVQYRNEASHSDEVEQFLSAKGLLEVADFVEALCLSLTELLNYKILVHRERRGEVRLIGEITESFRSGAVVARVEHATLSIGEHIFLESEGRSWCCQGAITSIQLNNISENIIEIRDATEVGFLFDTPVRTRLKLWQQVK